MIKVNLGCGKRDFGPDWIHIDGGDYPHLNKEYGSISELKMNNNSVDLLYASHLIAYFSREEFKNILKEWFRVLKPGGILRLATPDFDDMTTLYQSGGVELKDIIGPLYGKMRMGEEWIYHKETYDFKTLNHILIDSGFKTIVYYDWRKTDHAQFDDHSQAYLCPKGDKENGVLISLNIECVKP